MLFLQALLVLLVFDIMNVFCAFKTIYGAISGWKVRDKPGDAKTVERICSALNYACAWYPKQTLCLQRSFAMMYLLRKYGVRAQMVLGAQKLPFRAHAWVEVDGRAINERSDVQAAYGVWDRS